MRQSENKVEIRGKIKEIDLTNDTEKGCIRGKITMLVPQTIEGVAELDEVQVSAFASKITKAGKNNIQYEQLMKLMTEGVSVMAAGEEQASVFDITGVLDENTFSDRNGNDVTYTFVRGSFYNPTRSNFQNESYARFKQEIFIVEINDEEKNDELTGRLVIKGAVMNYGGPCAINYIVESRQAIDFIKMNWHEGETVMVQGLIRSKAELVESSEDDSAMGFGASFNESYVKTIKEYVVTAGSMAYPEERAFDAQEVATERANKKQKYEEKKIAKASKIPTPSTAAPIHQNMGFGGLNRGF